MITLFDLDSPFSSIPVVWSVLIGTVLSYSDTKEWNRCLLAYSNFASKCLAAPPARQRGVAWGIL